MEIQSFEENISHNTDTYRHTYIDHVSLKFFFKLSCRQEKPLINYLSKDIVLSVFFFLILFYGVLTMLCPFRSLINSKHLR